MTTKVNLIYINNFPYGWEGRVLDHPNLTVRGCHDLIELKGVMRVVLKEEFRYEGYKINKELTVYG